MDTGDEGREERRWKREFGYRVRGLRDERGLTQASLAHLARLHPTYVSGVERGLRNVSLVNIHRLAAALEVQPSALMEAPPSRGGAAGR